MIASTQQVDLAMKKVAAECGEVVTDVDLQIPKMMGIAGIPVAMTERNCNIQKFYLVAGKCFVTISVPAA